MHGGHECVLDARNILGMHGNMNACSIKERLVGAWDAFYSKVFPNMSRANFRMLPQHESLHSRHTGLRLSRLVDPPSDLGITCRQQKVNALISRSQHVHLPCNGSPMYLVQQDIFISLPFTRSVRLSIIELSMASFVCVALLGVLV